MACQINESKVLLLPPLGFKSHQWHYCASASACEKQVRLSACPK
jgi:hypothetical protein